MASSHGFSLVTIMLALALTKAFANDPGPLQDFCVADPNSRVFVNGLVCKDPKLVTPEDFSFSSINKPGNTANGVGSNVTLVNVAMFPGLNTIGLSIARIDFAPFGLNPPHAHPRANEVLTVIEGTLLAGFVTSNPNKLFAKTIHKGDLFVFPQGQIHFQLNLGKTNALALAGLTSQNPGVITIANATFGSMPPIPVDVLTKAFQVGKDVIEELMAQFK